MNNLEQIEENTAKQNLKVWFCEGCQAVHFKTKNVMLDFSKKEFVELTNTMLEIFKGNFKPFELNQLSGLMSLSDDIIFSETIS